MDTKTNTVPDRQRVSPKLVEFLFWTNVGSAFFLLIGFAAPGWLTVATRQITNDHYVGQIYSLVYQDYAIWYMTQCVSAREEPYLMSCESRSYRLLDNLNEGDADDVEISSFGHADLFFANFGSVFIESKVRTFQTFYTLSIVMSLILLQRVYQVRSAVGQGCYAIAVRGKVLLVLLALITALLTFIPIGVVTNVRGKLDETKKVDGNRLKSPFGIVFAGFGGASMIVFALVVVVWHWLCKSSVNEGPENAEGARDQPMNEV